MLLQFLKGIKASRIHILKSILIYKILKIFMKALTCIDNSFTVSTSVCAALSLGK